MDLVIVSSASFFKDRKGYYGKSLNDLVNANKGKVLALGYTKKGADSFKKELSQSGIIDNCDDFVFDSLVNFSFTYVHKFKDSLGIADSKLISSSVQGSVISVILDEVRNSMPDEECNKDSFEFLKCYCKFLDTIPDYDKLSRLHRLPSHYYEHFVDKGFSVNVTRRVLKMYSDMKFHAKVIDFVDLMINFNSLLESNKECVKEIRKRFPVIMIGEEIGLNALFVSCLSSLVDNIIAFDFEGNPKKI